MAITKNNTRMLEGSIGASQLDDTLDLSSKTVTLPAASVTAHVQAGGGKVLQVVMGTLTSLFQQISNNTKQDTGLSATITPSSTDSKIYVTTSAPIVLDNIGSANFYLDRAGSTVVGQNLFSTTSGYNTSTHNFVYLDSPSTTSAVTYKVQCDKDGGSIFYNYQNEVTSTAVMVLMEIEG